MNSIELYIEAAGKIAVWRLHHNAPCVLSMQDGKVVCLKATKNNPYTNNPLYISSFEIQRGMKGSRWTSIGTALHNLYCKELACQAHPKP